MPGKAPLSVDQKRKRFNDVEKLRHQGKTLREACAYAGVHSTSYFQYRREFAAMAEANGQHATTPEPASEPASEPATDPVMTGRIPGTLDHTSMLERRLEQANEDALTLGGKLDAALTENYRLRSILGEILVDRMIEENHDGK